MLSYQINSNDCLNITLIITVKHDNFNVSHWQSTWVPTHDHTYTTRNSKIFHYSMFLQQQELQRFFSSTCVSLTKFAFKCSFFLHEPNWFSLFILFFSSITAKTCSQFHATFFDWFVLHAAHSFFRVSDTHRPVNHKSCMQHAFITGNR